MNDDGQGVGVVGEYGQGSVGSGIYSQADVPIFIGNLGKAFGTFGAFVAGSEGLIEWLIQKSRNYIFSTAMPSAIAVATLESLRIVQTEHWRRLHLNALIQQFVRGAKALNLPLAESSTPIQPLIIGDAAKCLEISAALEGLGIYAAAIRPPTVPENSARIRITFSAAHTLADVDSLLMALQQVVHG